MKKISAARIQEALKIAKGAFEDEILRLQATGLHFDPHASCAKIDLIALFSEQGIQDHIKMSPPLKHYVKTGPRTLSAQAMSAGIRAGLSELGLDI